MPRYKKKNNKQMLVTSLKYSLLAVSFTVLAILVFALAVKNFDLADTDISIVNQIIKIGGIIYAAVFAARGADEKQILTAVFSAVIYITIGFIVFSVITGQLGNVYSLTADEILAAGIGAAAGILVAKVVNHDKYAKNT